MMHMITILEMDRTIKIEGKVSFFDFYIFMHNLEWKLLARSCDLLHNYYAHTILLLLCNCNICIIGTIRHKNVRLSLVCNLELNGHKLGL